MQPLEVDKNLRLRTNYQYWEAVKLENLDMSKPLFKILCLV
jgi:hypothetical protein